jgi:hypothetical protein
MSRGRWHFDAVSATLGAAVAITFFRVAGLTPPFLKSEAVAAWVQAVGSVAGIFAAIAIGSRQSKLMQESFEQERELARESAERDRKLRADGIDRFRSAVLSYAWPTMNALAELRDALRGGEVASICVSAITAVGHLRRTQERMKRLEPNLHILNFELTNSYVFLEDTFEKAVEESEKAEYVARHLAVQQFGELAGQVESTHAYLCELLTDIAPEGEQRQFVAETAEANQEG